MSSYFTNFVKFNALGLMSQLERDKARITGGKNQGVDSSMMADLLHSRQMESDSIIGKAFEIADSLGHQVLMGCFGSWWGIER